jgi:MFS family permease
MIASYLSALRRFNRDLCLYLAASALYGLAFDGVVTVLFNLYVLRLGFGPQQIGLVNAVAAVIFTLACLPAGAWVARWGSRRALIAGMALITTGSVLFPLVEFLPPAWAVPCLLAGNALWGLGLALSWVSGIPFLMAAAGPGARDHAFAAYAAVGPLSAFLGSLLGGALPGILASLLGTTLDEPTAYGYALWLPALVGVAAVLLLRAMREASATQVATQPTQVRRAADVRRAPYGLIAVVALIVVFRYAGNGAVTTFTNVYLDAGLGTSTAFIGALIAAGKLLSVPAVLATPFLVARWGRGRTVVLGSLLLALAALPLALVPHWAAAGVGYIGVTALFAITTTALRVYSQELVSSSSRSAMSAAFMTGGGLSASAVAFGGGRLIPSIGYSGLFLAGAVLTGLGAAVFWGVFRVPRGELARRAGAGAGLGD